MFHEVAIEPAYLSNWDRLRAIVDRCGFDTGRLISDFPKNKWRWQVYESCAGCLPAHKQRVVEYLNSLDNKLIRSGRQYQDSFDWIANAKREHDALPFHVVITAATHAGLADFVEGDDIQNTHPKWGAASAIVAQRTTSELTKPLRELLKHSREVLFIDPHFEPKVQYSKPLCEFVSLACKGRPVTRLEYHLEHDSTADHFKTALNKVVLPFLHLPTGVILRFVRWKSFNESAADAMHARYILTDLTGVRFDYGLCEGKEGETTDIQIVERTSPIYQQRWAQFNAASTAYDFVDGFEVSANGIAQLIIRDSQLVAV